MKGPWLSALVVGLTWLVIGDLGIFDALGMPFLALWPVILIIGYQVGKSPLVSWVYRFSTALICLVAIIAFTPLMRALTADIMPRSATDPQPVDAVMVLSGSVSRDSLLSPVAVDRLLFGVELARRGMTRTLVTSRTRNTPAITSDADQLRVLELLPDSVPWMIIDSATTTREEAVGTSKLAAKMAWNRVAIVTSPLHLRRACATFAKLLNNVECLASPGRELPVLTLSTPRDRIKALGPWLHEFLGWQWYRIRGWV